jgi:hypothetical protein
MLKIPIRNGIVSITGKSIADIFMKRNSIVSNFYENGKIAASIVLNASSEKLRNGIE